MDSFKVEVKRSFEHDLKKIDLRFIPKILDNIEKLSEEPFPPQSKKMKGSQSSYRLRVGDYRIIYQVDINLKLVMVFYVRHRKDAYRY